MPRINVGDVVVVAGIEWPMMVVTHSVNNKLVCIWFGGDRLCQGWFDPEFLLVVNSRETIEDDWPELKDAEG